MGYNKEKKRIADAARWARKSDEIKRRKMEILESIKKDDPEKYLKILEDRKRKAKEYAIKNRDKINQKMREYRKKKGDELREKLRLYRAINKDRINLNRRLSPHYMSEKTIKSRAEFRSKPEEKVRAYKRTLRWREKNKSKVLMSNMMRDRLISIASIGYLMYKDEILKIYNAKIDLEKVTGEKYHVDHICPIKNDNVCGLHVPWNLRIVTAISNLQKKNKLDMDLILS